MKLQDFHWWKFDGDLREESEIECPLCKTWTGTQDGWEGKFGRCVSCNVLFVALKCPVCREGINHHHKLLRVKIPGDPVPTKKGLERPLWATKRRKRK